MLAGNRVLHVVREAVTPPPLLWWSQLSQGPDKYFTVHSQKVRGLFLPELVVLVEFVFPWGIEYPVVFLPQGLFTLWCLQMA
jgi:hypothetical protein